ncbi:MAG TPA: hypothetical protein VGA68_04595 [Woeseiaceae bacterium]|jgi:hypothetical protein
MAQQKLRYFFPPHALTIAGLLVAACSGEIYVRDGVTDGDTFYLAERALTDSDPALQSWVSYSLTRSACQLQIGGDNPARATSFECELGARRHLIDTWSEQRAEDPDITDEYLDELTRVREAGFLAEYVADNFRRRGWQIPQGLDQRGFRHWRRVHLRGHELSTRLIGSWNYARNVNPVRQ